MTRPVGALARGAWFRMIAPVVLDDALREAELGVARRWRDEGLLEVEGVVLVGKGLMIGRTPSRSRKASS